MTVHPRKANHRKSVMIKHPHAPTPLSTWSDSTAVATVVPDGPLPSTINEVPLATLDQPCLDRADWERRAREMDFEEPPFDPEGKSPAAGAVVMEPDGRLWLVSPTNEFGQYKNTFPKGKAHGMSLKATALKEVFEEAGLHVELFEHLIDVTKTTSRTRYYLARRTGGHPAAMCWETQATHLVPLEKAKGMLNQPVDHQVTDALIEKWGNWAACFFRRDGEDPAREAAKSGQIPASRKDWPTLPLPGRRARISLDIRLDAHEAQNLRLGFVPQMMEQKWFAYFEGDTLHEHRSWTGFCISETHFQPDGDGLRATYADVNRQTGQYECTDDAEDARLITERIRQLAHLTEEDRNAEDLAPLNGRSAHGTEGSSEPPLIKMGRPITLPGPIGALAKKVGGVSALADELGVSPRTVRRWATNGVIPMMGLKVLKHLFEQHAVDPEGLVDAPVEE